jgi:hypothetical protein
VVQFYLTDSGWQVQPRGLETRILTQLEQMLTDAQLDYVGEADGKMRFQFQPKLTLIDPLRVKALNGQLEIERSSGLPVRIYCADAQKSTEWEVRFFRFNRAGRVELPFVPAIRFRVMVNKPITGSVRRKLVTILARRFEHAGVAYRFRWQGTNLTVMLDQALPRGAIELLVGQGRVELWRGRWVGAADTGTGRVLPVGIDAARQVELQELLGINGTLQAELDTTIPQHPGLAVSGGFPHREKSLYILLVDGKVFGTASAASTSAEVVTIRFFEGESEELLRAISVLLNTEPLPVDLRPEFSGSGR